MLFAGSEMRRLRDRLRDLRFDPYQIKSAELGGGQDAPFETAFSNLAHAFLKDKAPKLLDYEVGFQLIEKNGENTKAVGIFGFKVGTQWLYAPVFFLNGDLKGHELLYVKNQDLFVPMKENWVNYVLGKKPGILGDGVGRNLAELGVLSPNLSQLSRSPAKFASHMPRMRPWARDAMPDIAYLATTPLTKEAKFRDVRGLPEFLKEAGPASFRDFLEKVACYPGVVAAIDRFYGDDFLPGLAAHHRKALEKTAHAATSILGEKTATYPGCSHGRKPVRKKKASFLGGLGKQAADPRANVRVYREEEINANPDLILDLNDDERRRLLKARVVVKDGRSDGEVSAAYNIQTPFKTYNPDDTGLWEVLQKPDQFTRVLVIKGPYAANGRQEYATVVTADGAGKPWCNVHPGHLWARARYADQAFQEWLKKQKDASGVKESKTQVYVLIGPNGDGTVPFMVEGAFDDDGPTKVFNVKYLSGCTYTFPGNLPDHSYRGKRDPSNVFMNGERLVLTGMPGSKIVVRDGELYVPDGYKLLTIEPLDEDVKKQMGEQQKPEEGSLRKTKDQMPPPKILDSKDGKPTERTADQQEFLTRPHVGKTPMFVPGTITDLQLALLTHTLPLKIHSDGKDVTVNGRKKLDKESAWVHLTVDHHFREKVARYLVDEALRRGTVDVRVKYAAPHDDMIQGAPNAPGFPEPPRGSDSIMGSNVPSQEMQEDEVKVPDMSASKTDRSIYNPTGPDPKSMGVAQQAAETGQREVFDTAMLGSLLNAVREDSIVERYMGDLMKGLDRLGRILFQFYWHGEEFEDRYGKQDMPEMEDSLRNAFEGMGDIVLKLRQKTVDPYHDEATNVDLSSLANQ